MKELDLHLKLKKCRFGVEEVDFLGLRPGEIATPRNFPASQNGQPQQNRSFLGFANNYRRFIGNYSNILRPLIDLTKKEKHWNWSQKLLRKRSPRPYRPTSYRRRGTDTIPLKVVRLDLRSRNTILGGSTSKDTLHLDLEKKFHDHNTAGHRGYLKTSQLIQAGHWWPGKAKFITAYDDGCAPCQQNKTNTHPIIPTINPIKSGKTIPFKQISYDLITDLPICKSFDSLLVVVDQGLTKGVILCPTKKTVTAEGIAAIIFRKLYSHFRLFDKVISDRGPQFAANFQKELGRIFGYELALSSAYHPQTDGETERVNQEIETYLQIYCVENPSSWADNIPMAEFVHNIRPHSTTGKSPF